MRILLLGTGAGRRIRVFGWAGALGVVALLALLRALGGTPSAASVEGRVRLLLAREVSQAQLAELKRTGASVPDEQTASHWLADLEAVERIEMGAIEVRRPIPDAFSPRPAFVAKVAMSEPRQAPRTRYFWLSRHGFDHEVSRVAWNLAW